MADAAFATPLPLPSFRSFLSATTTFRPRGPPPHVYVHSPARACAPPLQKTGPVADRAGGAALYGASLRRAAGCSTEPERVVLVGVDVTTRANMGSRLFGIDESMEELGRLAETAGMSVVGVVTQALAQPYNGTYVGTGKVGEIRSEMEALGCKTCVFDDELSPAQQRTLEKAFGGEAKGIKVLDRTALILDIFGQHAASREGQLQVELAMYQYRLPRLTRMWTHLERQGGGSGGVGLRGPGETQLESDRRMINTRIVKLKREIDGVRMHRTRQRSARRKNVGLPVVALIGYTNAGKSTVLNSLTGANVLEADALFATLDPTTRRAQLEGLKLSPEILLTDTVGFVQNLPTQLVVAFRATLEEVTEADVLVHVVDSSLPWELMTSQIAAVENVLKQIDADGKPTIVALNKIDMLEAKCAAFRKDGARGGVVAEDGEGENDAVEVPMIPDELANRVSELTGYDCVTISAKSGAGCEEVGVLLEEVLHDVLIPVESLVPYDRGDLVAALHELGSCEFEDFTEAGTHVLGRAPHSLASRLREFAVDSPLGRSAVGAILPRKAEPVSEDDEDFDWTALAKGRH